LTGLQLTALKFPPSGGDKNNPGKWGRWFIDPGCRVTL